MTLDFTAYSTSKQEIRRINTIPMNTKVAFVYAWMPVAAKYSLWLWRLLWFFCPGCDKNEKEPTEQTDWQTEKNHNWPTAWQGRCAERLEKLSEWQTRASQLWLPEGKRNSEGSGLHSTLRDWQWTVFNLNTTGTDSKAILVRFLRERTKHALAFLSAMMPSSAETDMELHTDEWLPISYTYKPAVL